MPSIRKNEAQAKALDEITEALATIRSLNAILVTGWRGSVVLNYDTGESGRNKFVKLTVSAADSEREHTQLVKMAQARKSQLVKLITNRSLKFAIKLDKEDKLIMGPADAAIRANAGAAEDDAADQELNMDNDSGAVVEDGMPNEGQ